MKEIVSLFSCLPFTTTSASILPITSTNFYLFFIAFIVVFFLLGIIIGYILNPRRKLRRTKEKPLVDAIKDKPEEPLDLGQDIIINTPEPDRRINTREQGQRNYNNYWDYSNRPRRY